MQFTMSISYDNKPLHYKHLFGNNLPKLHTLNINGMIKENGFILKKARSGQYPLEIMTDTDYLTLLVNTPAQAESLLHSLEQVAMNISLYTNADKT